MFQKLFSTFRTNLISGVLAIAPLAAVIYVVAWFWDMVSGLRRLIPASLEPAVLFGIENRFAAALLDNLITLALLAGVVVAIAAIGLMSRRMLGQRALKRVEKFVERIPVLRTIYSTLAQLLDTFGGSQGKQFRRVVMVEYPRKGIMSLALVTGERSTHPATGEPGKYVNIFVPTTPNPTSGFYLTVPTADVVEMNMTVEEALKQIISMGIVQ